MFLKRFFFKFAHWLQSLATLLLFQWHGSKNRLWGFVFAEGLGEELILVNRRIWAASLLLWLFSSSKNAICGLTKGFLLTNLAPPISNNKPWLLYFQPSSKEFFSTTIEQMMTAHVGAGKSIYWRRGLDYPICRWKLNYYIGDKIFCKYSSPTKWKILKNLLMWQNWWAFGYRTTSFWSSTNSRIVFLGNVKGIDQHYLSFTLALVARVNYRSTEHGKIKYLF